MKIRKIMILAVAVMIAIAAGTGYYLYNKPVPSVADLTAKAVSATDLFKDFSTNEQMANQSFLNKAVQVSGKVLEVSHNQNQQVQVILDAGDPMFGIACTLDDANARVKRGDLVTIKGICTGFLNDVVLTRSLLLN